MNRNEQLAQALGLEERRGIHKFGTAWVLNGKTLCSDDYKVCGLNKYLASLAGQQAIRDRVHCEIGGSGYEIKIKVCERGRTDYGLWDAKTRLSVQPATRMKRDSFNVADDLPAFYADCLLWLTKEGK